MILHRITAIFAGINRDFTGHNHAQLAQLYGIPLPLVFQTVALAHQLKTHSRLKADPDLLSIAVRICDITRTPDGVQALTSAQVMLLANMVRTGGSVDVPQNDTPVRRLVAVLGSKALSPFGFLEEAPVIGDYAWRQQEDHTAKPSSASTLPQPPSQASESAVKQLQAERHQVRLVPQVQLSDTATHGPVHLPAPQVGQFDQLTSHFSGG